MKHIKSLETRDLCKSAKNGGCGECQTSCQTINKQNLKESAVKGGCGEGQASCQSACKTSCGIANQKCENKSEKK